MTPSEVPRFRHAARIALTIVGGLFGGVAAFALAEREFAGAILLLALALACLIGAWTGRDPHNRDAFYRSFRVTRVKDDLERLRRDDERTGRLS